MQGRFVWQRSVAARTPFSVPDAASAAEYIGCVVVTHAWVLVSGSLPQHGCRHVCLPAYRQVFNNNGKHCPCPVHPPLLQSCSRTQQSACVHSHVGDCSESQAPASCKRLWTHTTAPHAVPPSPASRAAGQDDPSKPPTIALRVCQ